MDRYMNAILDRWMSFGIIVNTFGMDSTQVGVFKKTNRLGLTCLLQSTNSFTLEAQICFELLSNFSHQTLERKSANQKFSGLFDDV
ncbi:hypothetical protein PAL_GLEAN10004839 [Pteropus alecto]|uniref:Uncharacterized protein n=1 Tax=Pteropus alecto TaxID=9402 RepID=L5KV40_PTEAL|nr:hypothetical protein PAL_GLEAN10004839 [Pteropus alecto]